MLIFQDIASDVLRFEASGWWYEEIAKVHLPCFDEKCPLKPFILYFQERPTWQRPPSTGPVWHIGGGAGSGFERPFGNPRTLPRQGQTRHVGRCRTAGQAHFRVHGSWVGKHGQHCRHQSRISRYNLCANAQNLIRCGRVMFYDFQSKTCIFTAKEWVTMQDFIDSHDKITIGTDWKSRQKDKEDLKVSVFSNLYYNCTSKLRILGSRQKKYEILVKHASTPPPHT